MSFKQTKYGASLLLTRCFCLVIFTLVSLTAARAADIIASKDHLTVSELSTKQVRYLKKLNQKQLDSVATVAVLDDQGQLLGQVWGSVTLNDEQQLRFTPRFPFDDNRRYFARVQVGKNNTDLLSKRFVFLTETQKPQTQVTAIYPSADVLPENLFKFYIHFSHPMSQGDAYPHIQLLDANQQPVELPFLELTQELWDPDGKRFTLLFDPGRTKKGIKPNRDMGLPLQQGQRFTLVIDSDWRDAKGLPLQKPFRKTFTVGPQDQQQPDIHHWVLSLPDAGSRNPVIVKFDEPLDRAQLQNALWIETADGKYIAGEVEIENELIWRFTPTHGWRSGDYRLVAKSYLEDRAANSLGRAFEVIRTENDPDIPDTYSLEFTLDTES